MVHHALRRRPGLSLFLALTAACGDQGPDTPEAPAHRSECLARAVFPEPSTSAYCLPFGQGASYTLSQSYCAPPPGSHQIRFAWDFDMPVGTEILASRGGVVVELREHWLDTDPQGGHENMVSLRHDDNTISLYIHMRTRGCRWSWATPCPRAGSWAGAEEPRFRTFTSWCASGEGSAAPPPRSPYP